MTYQEHQPMDLVILIDTGRILHTGCWPILWLICLFCPYCYVMCFSLYWGFWYTYTKSKIGIVTQRIISKNHYSLQGSCYQLTSTLEWNKVFVATAQVLL